MIGQNPIIGDRYAYKLKLLQNHMDLAKEGKDFKTHNKRFMRTHQIKFKHARYKNCNLKDVLFQNNMAYNY